jgi:hypothetical protein
LSVNQLSVDQLSVDQLSVNQLRWYHFFAHFKLLHRHIRTPCM